MRLVLLVSAVALVACDSGPVIASADLSLRTDRTAYAVGDDVELTFANDSAVDVALNSPLPCSATLEQRVGDAWAPVTLPVACFAVVVPGPAGERTAATVRLEDVTPGTYRFRAWPSVGGRQDEVISPTVTVH